MCIDLKSRRKFPLLVSCYPSLFCPFAAWCCLLTISQKTDMIQVDFKLVHNLFLKFNEDAPYIVFYRSLLTLSCLPSMIFVINRFDFLHFRKLLPTLDTRCSRPVSFEDESLRAKAFLNIRLQEEPPSIVEMYPLSRSLLAKKQTSSMIVPFPSPSYGISHSIQQWPKWNSMWHLHRLWNISQSTLFNSFV